MGAGKILRLVEETLYRAFISHTCREGDAAGQCSTESNPRIALHLET
jgi:hypothetical protein